MICAALVSFAAVFGWAALAAPTLAQTSAGLEGQVVNGTHGIPAASVSNLTVTLFQMGQSGPVTRTVQTNASGRFSFGAIPAEASSPYFARVDYAGVPYFSDILQPQTGATAPISMTVYETQTLPASYQIDRAHLILDVGQRSLNAVELLQVSNPTDRAFLLPLPLPGGSINVNFNDLRDQYRVVQNDDGSLSFPILPTTQQVLFGEQLLTHPPGYTLHLQLPQAVGQLNVLVGQAGSVQASSAQLSPGPPFTPQSGSIYSQLKGTNLAAGSTVTISISNLPGADTFPMVRIFVLIGGGLGALALLVFPFIRRRRAQPPVDFPVTATHRLGQLEAMAELDQAFEAGELPEDEYRAERAAIKAQLLK